MGDPARISVRVPCPYPSVGDFYSPFFRVRFFASIPTLRDFEKSENERRRENNRAPIAFTLREQPVTNAQQFAEQQILGRAQQAVIDSRGLDKYAAELEVTHVGSSASSLSLTLTPPYDEAVAILDDRVIQNGSMALVEFGYASPSKNDILSGPFLFTLNQPECEFGEQIRIVLKGQDLLSHNLMRRENKRIWKRGKQGQGEPGASGGSYPTDLDIVTAMALEFGLTINTDAVEEGSPLRQRKANALEQAKGDWIFFKEILSHNNASWLICGKTLFISDQRVIVFSRSPRYRLMYRRQLQSDADIPVSNLQFESRQDLFAPRKIKGITKISPDRDAGGASQTEVRADNTGVGSLGGNTYAGDTGSNKSTSTPQGPVKSNRELPKGQSGSIVSGSQSDDQLLGRVKHMAEEAKWSGGVKGTATIPGVPGLRPQEKILLEGVPKYYEGEYLINKVVHRVGTSGYTTECEISKDSFKTPITGTKKNPGPTSEKTKTSAATETPKKISRFG